MHKKEEVVYLNGLMNRKGVSFTTNPFAFCRYNMTHYLYIRPYLIAFLELTLQ